MQGARWWRETTSESTNARKKKKKVEKMGNKTRRRTLHTHSNITQQQEPHKEAIYIYTLQTNLLSSLPFIIIKKVLYRGTHS